MANIDSPIIIKKVKKAAHAHHGGAWKIAYADFVTAMMAFFLLLWLISMASPEQKKGLADYFAPPNISESTSGAGGIMGGKSASIEGARLGGAAAEIRAEGSQDSNRVEPTGDDTHASKASLEDLKSQEDLEFQSAAASIKQAWQALPNITEIAANLILDVDEDGLNIQLVEQNSRRMFPEGSKYPLEGTRAALAAIAPLLQQLPNQIRITGHTAAGQAYSNPRYGAWDLSSDRANATRQVLMEFGLSVDRIYSVVRRATEEPLFPNDPYLGANERVVITAMRAAPPVPAGIKP